MALHEGYIRLELASGNMPILQYIRASHQYQHTHNHFLANFWDPMHPNLFGFD